MEITIPKITFRLEILILIVFFGFLLFSHLIFSCCMISGREGMAVAKAAGKKIVEKMTNKQSSDNKKKINGKGKGTTATATATATGKEGFTPANTNGGQSALTNAPPVNTTSWFQPNLTYGPGQPPSPIIQEIFNRPANVPLPKGELDFFASTQFNPTCCMTTGASYSNSLGCACMSVPQVSYLNGRGGNNIPPDPEGY